MIDLNSKKISKKYEVFKNTTNSCLLFSVILITMLFPSIFASTVNQLSLDAVLMAKLHKSIQVRTPNRNEPHISVTSGSVANMIYEYDGVDINELLLLRAQEAGLNLNGEIILLPPLSNAGNLLTEQLREEMLRYEEGSAERTVLIPLNIDNIHWVALAVRFSQGNDVVSIQYIDPMGDSIFEHDIPGEIRSALRAVYGPIYIENLLLLRQTDTTSCGALTVENLIRVAQGRLESVVVDEGMTMAIRENHISLLETYRNDLNFRERQRNDISEIFRESFLSQRAQAHFLGTSIGEFLSLFSDKTDLRNIILLGKPGVGKGTLSEIFTKKYGYTHLSIGDIFRSAMRDENKAGKIMTSLIAKGEDVPLEIYAPLIEQELSKTIAVGKPFIMDNFPKTPEEVAYVLNFIKKAFGKIDSKFIVVVIDLNDDEILDRIMDRRICPKCGKNYNLKTRPPRSYVKNAKKEFCDTCNTKLIRRPEDDAENLKKVRLPSFQDKVLPAIRLLEMELDIYVIQRIFELFEIYLGASLEKNK